jgi:hypothetical protein
VLDSLKEFGGSATLSGLESSVTTAFDTEGSPLDILRRVEGRVQSKREGLEGRKINTPELFSQGFINPAYQLQNPTGMREATLGEKASAESLGKLEKLLERQIQLMEQQAKQPQPVEITGDKRPTAPAANPWAGMNDQR